MTEHLGHIANVGATLQHEGGNGVAQQRQLPFFESPALARYRRTCRESQSGHSGVPAEDRKRRSGYSSPTKRGRMSSRYSRTQNRARSPIAQLRRRSTVEEVAQSAAWSVRVLGLV